MSVFSASARSLRCCSLPASTNVSSVKPSFRHTALSMRDSVKFAPILLATVGRMDILKARMTSTSFGSRIWMFSSGVPGVMGVVGVVLDVPRAGAPAAGPGVDDKSRGAPPLTGATADDGVEAALPAGA